MTGGARPLAPWMWLGVPMLQVMTATIVFAVPLRVWGLSLPEPVFAMPLAFAWAIIRPSMLGPVCLMILGLFLDMLWGGPMGLWPVCLLLPYGAVLASRSILQGQSRMMMWVWYSVATLLAFGTGYLLTMLKAQSMPSLISVAWQLIVTILLFPFADRLIDRFEDADVRFR